MLAGPRGAHGLSQRGRREGHGREGPDRAVRARARRVPAGQRLLPGHGAGARSTTRRYPPESRWRATGAAPTSARPIPLDPWGRPTSTRARARRTRRATTWCRSVVTGSPAARARTPTSPHGAEAEQAVSAYRFRAARADGGMVHGVIEASSTEQASALVYDRGLFPVTLSAPGRGGTPRRARAAATWRSRFEVSRRSSAPASRSSGPSRPASR